MANQRPYVSQITFDANTWWVTVQISDTDDPTTATMVLQQMQIKSPKELNYYLNALFDNIGANNVAITHVEDANGHLQKIFIGKQTGSGSGSPYIAPPPVTYISNIIPFDGSNHNYALEFGFDDGSGFGPIYSTMALMAGTHVIPKIDPAKINTLLIYSIGGETPPGTVQVSAYLNGTRVKVFLAVNGTSDNLDLTQIPGDYDTLQVEPAGHASTTSLNWFYKNNGAPKGSLTVKKNGTIWGQSSPDAISQSGSFNVVGGDAIIVLGYANATQHLKITNLTDNIVLVDLYTGSNETYPFAVVAGKSYQVEVTALS